MDQPDGYLSSPASTLVEDDIDDAQPSMFFCNVCKNPSGSDVMPGEHNMSFRQLQVAALSGCRWCSMLFDGLNTVIDDLSNAQVSSVRVRVSPYPSRKDDLGADSHYSGHCDKIRVIVGIWMDRHLEQEYKEYEIFELQCKCASEWDVSLLLRRSKHNMFLFISSIHCPTEIIQQETAQKYIRQ